MTSHVADTSNNLCLVCGQPLLPPTSPTADVQNRLRELLATAYHLANARYLFQGNPDAANIARLFEAVDAVADVSHRVGDRANGSFA